MPSFAGMTGFWTFYETVKLVAPRPCFDHSNLDHAVLPFDLAQGGELVEPFRISNFVLRI